MHFEEEVRHTLFDLSRMEDELSRMLGRQVDLIERVEIEQSHDDIRRKAILQSTETIYAAPSRPLRPASTRSKSSQV